MGFIFKQQAAGGNADILSQTWGNESYVERFKTDPSWTWGNQDTCTLTHGPAGGRWVSSSEDELHAYWSGWTPPASGDFAFMVSSIPLVQGNSNSNNGAIVLQTGTTATPTLLKASGVRSDATTGPSLNIGSWTAYTAGALLATDGLDADGGQYLSHHTIIAWDDSASSVIYHTLVGGSGVAFKNVSTVQTKPTDFGIFGTASNGTTGEFLFTMAKLVPVADAATWPYPELYGNFS